MATITNVSYQRNAFDYLTPCKNHHNIMIGSYECFICKHFKGFGKEDVPILPLDPSKNSYYKRYFVLITGTIKCDKY